MSEQNLELQVYLNLLNGFEKLANMATNISRSHYELYHRMRAECLRNIALIKQVPVVAEHFAQLQKEQEDAAAAASASASAERESEKDSGSDAAVSIGGVTVTGADSATAGNTGGLEALKLRQQMSKSNT